MSKSASNKQLARMMRRRAGVTLVELLVVMGIIVILGTIATPFVVRGINAANRAQAMSEISSIVRAIEAYQREYGRLPGSSSHYSNGNAELINVLRAHNGVGNNNHANNPRRYNFLSISEESLSGERNDPVRDYMDPWGDPYEIMIDRSGEGRIDVPDQLGEPVRRTAVAWSMGGRNDEPERALRSW